MKRIPAKPLLALSFLIALFSFNACQKETVVNPGNAIVNDIPTSSDDRSASGVTFGVTLPNATTPSQIVGIIESTGNAMAPVTAFTNDPVTGNPINLDLLKGICYTSFGQWFLTTGAPASTALGASIYDNALYKVNPFTGQCGYIGSVCPYGAVSDLEFDPQFNNFVGLMDNSNRTIRINPDPFGNYTVYSVPTNVGNIAAGYTLQGLSIVRHNTLGIYYVGAASSPGLVSKLYNVPAQGNALAAIFMTDLNPFASFAGGHPALSFDIQLNHMAINRSAAFGAPLGLSEINPWLPPLGIVTFATQWGPPSVDFEDLASYIY